MELCSTIRKNEIMLFSGKWKKLENFMLSKGSQAQKINGRMFSHILEARPISYMYI
jgi:hypothetical protein